MLPGERLNPGEAPLLHSHAELRMCDHDHVDLVSERKGDRCASCRDSEKPSMSHWEIACKDCGLLGHWCELADAFSWAVDAVEDAIPDAVEEVVPEVAAILGNPLPAPGPT